MDYLFIYLYCISNLLATYSLRTVKKTVDTPVDFDCE